MTRPRNAFEAAAGLCVSRTNYEIEVEHYLTKALDSSDNDIAFILKQYGVDKTRLANELQRSLDRLKRGNARGIEFQPVAGQDADRGVDHRHARLRRQ